MSLKDLEQYQELGKRNPFDFVTQTETKEEETKRLEKIRLNRVKAKQTKPFTSKGTWSNTYKKYLEPKEFTEELIESEIEFTPYI